MYNELQIYIIFDKLWHKMSFKQRLKSSYTMTRFDISKAIYRKPYIKSHISKLIYRKSYIEIIISKVIYQKSYIKSHMSKVIYQKSYIKRLFHIGVWTFARSVRPLLATILCTCEIWSDSTNRVCITYFTGWPNKITKKEKSVTASILKPTYDRKPWNSVGLVIIISWTLSHRLIYSLIRNK